jgi:hypothetical protein
MERQSGIDALIRSLGIYQGDLITHKRAFESLSKHGNEKTLEAIPEETRTQIAKLYKELTKNGIFCYNPETGKYRRQISYLEAWAEMLKNNPNMPEFSEVTISEVEKMLKEGLTVGPKVKGNIKFGLLPKEEV